FLCSDGYKVGHHLMYPQGTTLVYSNFTPRSNKHAPKGCSKIVVFGTQMTMMIIQEMFDKNFFKSHVYKEHRSAPGKLTKMGKSLKEKTKQEVCQEIKREYSMYLGSDYDVSHIEALWDLGYLPIEVKSLPEGTDRKSTRLNSSHVKISYAVFCLKKK